MDSQLDELWLSHDPSAQAAAAGPSSQQQPPAIPDLAPAVTRLDTAPLPC